MKAVFKFSQKGHKYTVFTMFSPSLFVGPQPAILFLIAEVLVTQHEGFYLLFGLITAEAKVQCPEEVRSFKI